MKILIIDENGVKEFLPSEAIQQKPHQPKAQDKETSTRTENQENVIDQLKVYTMAELTKIFKTSRPNIYSWIDKGWLKQTTIGGRKYFKREDVEKMLNEHREK